MRKWMRSWAAILLFALISLPTSPAQQKSAPQKPRPITEAEIQALILAIQDEIYDYDYQREFAVLAEAKDRVELPVYISPTLRPGDTGAAIYKLMPYGEVIRCFYPEKGGLIALCANPENGFPPTSENMKTVYLEDENILERKHTWIKRRFSVLFDPSAERVGEASKRQKTRVGFSYAESTKNKARP